MYKFVGAPAHEINLDLHLPLDGHILGFNCRSVLVRELSKRGVLCEPWKWNPTLWFVNYGITWTRNMDGAGFHIGLSQWARVLLACAERQWRRRLKGPRKHETLDRNFSFLGLRVCLVGGSLVADPETRSWEQVVWEVISGTIGRGVREWETARSQFR